MHLPAATFGGEVVSFMDAGARHSMVVTDTGVLWACGYGSQGQLGLGDAQCYREMQRVGGKENFGGQPVLSIHCSNSQSLIVTHDDSVWACGWDVYATLGTHDGPVGSNLVPVWIDPARFDNNTVVVVCAAPNTRLP